MVSELRYQRDRTAVEPDDQLFLGAGSVVSPPCQTVPSSVGDNLDGVAQPGRNAGEGQAGISRPLCTCQTCDAQGPLCDFLGKPVPDVPFPRVNDSEALQELLTIIIKRGLYNAFKRAVRVALPLLLLGVGTWLYYRHS